MKWRIKLVLEAIPGCPVEHELGIIERSEEISPATAGLTVNIPRQSRGLYGVSRSKRLL
jgi:hypothetical protein